MHFKASPRSTAWPQRLYELFASIRDSLKDYGEDEIDEGISQAVQEARKQKPPIEAAN